MATLDFQHAQMPPLIQRVSGLTGPTLAIRFARHFGGQKIYVPKKMHGTHPLAKCMGMQAAQLLSDNCGGEDWVVPSASNYLTWLDARALRVCGLSQPEIARKLDITLRHAGRLLAGFDPETIEVNDVVRGIARRYGIGPRRSGSALPTRRGPQTDFGFPEDARGLRLTSA